MCPYSHDVLNTVKFRHGIVDATPQRRRMAYLFNGYTSFRLAGSMFEDLFHNTLSCILEGEDSEGREEKDHEHRHEGALLHSHVHSQWLRPSHTSPSQGGGTSLLPTLLRELPPGRQRQSTLVFFNNKLKTSKQKLNRIP